MNKLQFAKNVIKEAEEHGIENLKSLAELKEWARNYNKVANENGEGYVPDVMAMPHIEKYEWALKVVAELEPVEEIEEVEEEIEEENKMANVMKRAWEIAKEGQVKFGGKVSEYLSEAMKIAWAESKQDVKVEIVLAPGSRKHKSWLAKIDGSHPQYRLNRVFLQSESQYDKVYNVENGIYEACDGGERYFIEVSNGQYSIVSDDWVYANVA